MMINYCNCWSPNNTLNKRKKIDHCNYWSPNNTLNKRNKIDHCNCWCSIIKRVWSHRFDSNFKDEGSNILLTSLPSSSSKIEKYLHQVQHYLRTSKLKGEAVRSRVSVLQSASIEEKGKKRGKEKQLNPSIVVDSQTKWVMGSEEQSGIYR